MERKEVENLHCDKLEEAESQVWTTSIWTDNMLRALKEGVKGGRWHSLIDKVYTENNLKNSFQKVKSKRGCSGVDKVTIEQYEKHLDRNVERVAQKLRNGTYNPQPVKRVMIPKPGSKDKRPLGIPTVEDKMVQMATYNVIAPIFEKDFSENSFGFRPNRGCKDALRGVEKALKDGYLFVVDADIKGYFDNIPHGRLINKIKRKIADRRLIELIQKFLKQKILDELKEWEPEKGTPQGAVLSPLLSNIFLDDFDHLMTENGHKIVRYADDWIVLCKTKEEAEEVLRKATEWMKENELTLHPTKTRIVNLNIEEEYFEFLGYKFKCHKTKTTGKKSIKKFPRDKSIKKFRDKIRDNTKRSNGNSLGVIIKKINPSLKGWYQYFKHSHRTTFTDIDRWVRMRLRSILRKRIGLRGRGRGLDHKRWQNKFFISQGLFSLVAAYEEEISILRQGNH